MTKPFLTVAPGPGMDLSNAKQKLLHRLRSGQHTIKNPGPSRGIKRRLDSGPTPLSFSQQQVWFFNQLEPTVGLYNIPVVIELRGNLNVEALRTSLNSLVERHEILRTRFIPGIPPQQMCEVPRPLALSIDDLRPVPEPARTAEAERLVAAEVQAAFDLSRDLMIRARLVRLAQDHWRLVVVLHHIAADVWSWRLICRELAESYEAALSQRVLSRPELPIQYADFAAWQQQHLAAGALERERVYWRQQLDQAPKLLELPLDYPRPPIQSFRGSVETLILPDDLAGQLDELGRQEGATLFMVLLTAFFALLYRYTSQEDILVASPTAGRSRTEIENLIGNFVNTLVLRARVQNDLTFKQLLRQCRETVVGALSHQEFPFEKLVEELRPERSASHLPLVQVMFALQDELAENFKLPGLEITALPADTGTAKFDLTLTLVESGKGLKACMEYNSRLFDRPTISQLLRHYRQVLSELVKQPGGRLGEFELLNSEERHKLLFEWNQSEREYPRRRCVHELFQEQAKQHGESVAVLFGEEQLTYRMLEERANRLSRYLQKAGVNPGTLVGIALDRSAEMIVAILGVLKAGGAYVPLDPARALERARFVLQDAGISIVITQQHWLSAWREQPVSCVCVDSDWPKIAGESDAPLAGRATPEDLIYVIYTSGSTGQPKGVEIEHRCVVNFLDSMRREPGVSQSDILLSVTSLSFDIAGLEIFLPLITGARLVIADAETVLDGVRLARLISDCGATVMQATPATWRLLLDSGWTGAPQLRIFCGGERLSGELTQQLLGRAASLWNLYGPTETTIWSTLAKIESASEPISIGKPIANTQVYILDKNLRPLPIGVPGELFIGGAGVARGYLNRPELTAQKFLKDPFRSDPAARVYRTGDQARFLPDGRIEFLGRRDHQVKIRGHRVELQEIESVLGQFPGMRGAAVMLREDTPGSPRLVAYMVCSAEAASAANLAELRHFLTDRLPDYAVPSAFVFLEAMPLTPSGKMDRAALPAPERTRTQLDQNVAGPRTPVEKQLTGIWCEVLDLPEAGADENFFELGGHSLKVTQLISRIRQVFQVELSFIQVLQKPTIRQLAVQIEDSLGKDPITHGSERRIIKRRTNIQAAAVV